MSPGARVGLLLVNSLAIGAWIPVLTFLVHSAERQYDFPTAVAYLATAVVSSLAWILALVLLNKSVTQNHDRLQQRVGPAVAVVALVIYVIVAMA